MWLRKLGKNGNAETIVLPPAALAAVGWERGDYVAVRVQDDASILLTKVNFAELADRVREAVTPLPVIRYV